MRFILAIVATVLMVGCANSKPNSMDKAKANETAGALFTVDGVTVYRFSDGGRYHYFAVRTGRADTVAFSTWSESCGKNCTRTVSEELPLMAELPR